MKWEHLTFDQRKVISNMLASRKKLYEIAHALDKDPTSISKEIKRNRVKCKVGYHTNKVCIELDRYPFVCNNCKNKYYDCPFSQYKYDAKKADEKAKIRLVHSRTGLNIEQNEFEILNNVIKEGVDRKESIYHILKSNDSIKVSVPTIYRWINQKKLSTQRMDLPFAVKYKKRRNLKKYDYPNNNIDRSNRTYLDYLDYRRNSPGMFGIQMDFLGRIITDSNIILTLVIPELQFIYLRLINKPNSFKVKDVFDKLEESLGINDFAKIFPSILTDRDPCFSNFLELEVSPSTGEKRTSVYYCDSFRSTQKANVENFNKQLRQFFKKGKSIDHITDEDVKQVNKIMISYKKNSLSGKSPEEAFIKIYGSNTLNKLFDY